MKALDPVRIFVTALQQGSLSAAARALGLSPATVSRRITALEEELGVRLLDRNSRQLMPTEAGQIYHQRMERILEDVAQTENLARHIKQAPEGKLRVHSRTLLGIRLIAPLLTPFDRQSTRLNSSH